MDGSHGNDDSNSDTDGGDRIVDWLLGEASETEAHTMRHAAASDPGAALAAAEMRCLLESLRELSVEPRAGVGLAVRHAVERRVRLRGDRRTWRPVEGLVFALKVAAVAATVVGAVLLGERLWAGRRVLAEVGDRVAGVDAGPARAPAGAPSGVPGELSARDDADASGDAPLVVAGTGAPAGADPQRAELPGVAPRPRYLRQDPRERVLHPYRLFHLDDKVVKRFAPPHANVEQARPQDVWFCAINSVASMRVEFHNRIRPELRRAAIRAAGGSSYLPARIETLSDEIATKIDRGFAESDVDVAAVALSLRAFLAGGSTLRVGTHQDSVRRCVKWLEARLPDLHGGELATALSGLMDVAVLSGPKRARLVGEHASRLAESIIYSNNRHRPTMLNWQTTAAQLADAGQVLRLAPAFGTVNKEALLARAYLATHLSERIALSTSEVPDLLAAHLYGFGDLIDRAEIEHKLRLWRARDLVPGHYVALHHVAWSRFPLRSGWADFQRELRAVSATATPESAADAAALLLALAVNYAAPGSHEVLELAMR